jgi:hypothetical protein
MKTLIIYDNTGKIYYMASGDYTKPNGLQYIEVEIPEGYFVSGIDVENQTAIFEKYPKSQEQLTAESITDLQLALAEVTELLLASQEV